MKKMWGRIGMEILLEDSEHEEVCRKETDPARIGKIVSDAIASGKALLNGESYFVEQDNLGGDYANKEEEISFDYRDDTLFQSFELPVLNRPYNRAEVVRKCTAGNRISGIVRVSLCDLLEKDQEGFLDQLNEELVGDIMLSDLYYKIVGHQENDLFLFVEAVIDNGDISYDAQVDEFDHEPLAKEFYFRSTINSFGLIYFAKQIGMDYVVSLLNGHTHQNITWYTKTEMIRNIRKGQFVLTQQMPRK